jgi:two-component system, response regulator PdtaR
MGTVVNEADKICILVVEDEFFIAEWVAESLSDLGFAVEIASNARDALRCLKSAPVDVLFTDINLPGGMDGAALARQARQFLPELPVIYASARVATLEPEARVSGAVFVRKPYEPEMVGRLIAEVTRPISVAVPA